MNHELLYKFYKWSESHPILHRLCRHIILNIEVPIIRIFLCPLNAQLITRNSIHSHDDFNLFMSDIDFTIVFNNEEDTQEILSKRNSLKKFLPNIGECEIFCRDEWELKLQLEKSPLYPIWTSVYLIRKLGWQKKSLANANTEYDREKVRRALGITMRKLGHANLPLSGDALFPFLKNSPKAFNSYLTSSTSLFLATTIGTATTKADLCFQSINEYERFRLILPDTREHPRVPMDVEIKQYLMLNELLVATISLRLVAADGDKIRSQEIAHWINDLNKRGCPTILMALE